ncbi:MAG: hypothetical protein WCV82_04530, partial [Candidatus Paceibacterota bacterium]
PVSYCVLAKRVSGLKWPIEKAIQTPQQTKTLKAAFGEMKTLKAWAEDARCIVSFQTLRSRLSNYKWSLEKALTTPRSIKAEDRVGQQYGYLIIEALLGQNQRGERLVQCRCTRPGCNRVYVRRLNGIASNKTCGCERRDSFGRRILKHGQAFDKARNPLYTTWYNLNIRCSNPRAESYPHYGGRGIFVCDEWKRGQPKEAGLLAFLAWCKDNPRPTKGHSLDRIENNGPYAPWNCKWSTASEQALNRRTIRDYEQQIKAKDQIIAELMAKIQTFQGSL